MTALYPIFGLSSCSRCAREISRETRIKLALRTAERGDWLDRDQELCAECASAPVTTFTEFAGYLTQGGFGSATIGESPVEAIEKANKALIEGHKRRDPASPCG
jgi:hypothetical protein